MSSCKSWRLLLTSLLFVLLVACGDGGGVTVGTGGQDPDDALPSGDGPDETPIDAVPAVLTPATITLQLDQPVAQKSQSSATIYHDVDDNDDEEDDENGQGGDNGANNGNAGGNGNGNGPDGNNAGGNGNGNGNAAEPTYEICLAGAWLQVTAIRFDLEQSYVCDVAGQDAEATESPLCLEQRVEFSGSWQVDLLEGSFDPFVENWLLPQAAYSRVRIALDQGLDNNVTLVGVLKDGQGLNQAFTIDISIPGSILAQRSAPLVLAEQGGDILVEFSRSAWFAGIAENLADCAASAQAVYSEDDVLLVTETQGAGPCNKVRGNLKSNFVSAASFK